MQKLSMACLVTISLLASCASYTPQPVTLPRANSVDFFREEQAFFVGVTPYLDAEKSKQTFDADLNQAGILALQVLAKNNGERSLVVRKSDFVLRLQDGREYAPGAATSAATKLESSAGVVGATIAFGLIGYMASSSQQDQVNSARRADFRNKEFQDKTLGPQESSNGFLFFFVPEDVKQVNSATLIARSLDVADSSAISVVVPLGNTAASNGQKESRQNEQKE